MKRIFILVVIMALILGFSTQAHADLTLLGQGTSTHGTYNLIYDSDFDITWYDYTNSYNTWQNQMNWAAALSVITAANTYDDWRLPTSLNQNGSGPCTGDGGGSGGYNCTGSEMGHLYYTELGNSLGGPLANTGDFQNLQSDFYWSGTEHSAVPTSWAWLFYFGNGLQTIDVKDENYYALAVRDGLAVVTEPISCVDFEPPMASGPVTVKKNRVLPLKAQLLDTGGNSVTDSDIASLPVLQVLYDYGIGGDPVDVTYDALPAGQGTDGNQFVFSDSKWHFNLKTKNYTAVGTYYISMVSGDDSEYMIDPMCEATFAIE